MTSIDFILTPDGLRNSALKAHTEPKLWTRLEATYVGAHLEENWEALFQTMALYRDVATEVAGRLGLEYLQETDQRMVEHLRRMRRLEPTATVLPHQQGTRGRVVS